MSYRKPFFLIAAISFGAATAPAMAGDGVAFKYKTYELETVGGTADLYDRLSHRAEQLCTNSGPITLASRAIERECIVSLTEEFVGNIDHPRLSRYHARYGAPAKYANQ